MFKIQIYIHVVLKRYWQEQGSEDWNHQNPKEK